MNSPKSLRLLLGLAACVLPPLSLSAQDSLQPPFRVLANGQPISVDVGHAAPLMVDFDGDGVRDLLVGQFGQGKLRIYRNAGTDKEPKFSQFAWFQAGGADGKVPSG